MKFFDFSYNLVILWVYISRLLAERFVRDKKILEKRICLFVWGEFAFLEIILLLSAKLFILYVS